MINVITAAEAAKLIKSGDMFVFNGFGSQCFPEEMAVAIGQRFLATGEPNRKVCFRADGRRVVHSGSGARYIP